MRRAGSLPGVFFAVKCRVGALSPSHVPRVRARWTSGPRFEGDVVECPARGFAATGGGHEPLHACFGLLAESGTFFYAEGTLGDVPFTGRGDCRTTRQNHPEAGVSVQRCFMELSGLPPAYVGGKLTTNTIGSRNALGDRTDPPGYTQPSIATIRLWKRR